VNSLHDLPDEQLIISGDKIIGIDWGKNGDEAVQVTLKKETGGKLIITEVRVLDEP